MRATKIIVDAMHIPGGGHDYWCDAYIETAYYWDTGEWLTDDEIDELNEDSDFVWASVEERVY